MRVELANTDDYNHEDMIRAMSEAMHWQAEDVAAYYIQAGAILLTVMALDVLEELPVQLVRLRAQLELEPMLDEIRQRWAAGILADFGTGRE